MHRKVELGHGQSTANLGAVARSPEKVTVGRRDVRNRVRGQVVSCEHGLSYGRRKVAQVPTRRRQVGERFVVQEARGQVPPFLALLAQGLRLEQQFDETLSSTAVSEQASAVAHHEAEAYATAD